MWTDGGALRCPESARESSIIRFNFIHIAAKAGQRSSMLQQQSCSVAAAATGCHQCGAGGLCTSLATTHACLMSAACGLWGRNYNNNKCNCNCNNNNVSSRCTQTCFCHSRIRLVSPRLVSASPVGPMRLWPTCGCILCD